MARNVSVLDMVARVRALTDRENDDFITDGFILSELSSGLAECWDRLVSRFENYYVDTYPLTTSAGQETYDLPDDFLKLLYVDQADGDDWVSLYPFNNAERNRRWGDGGPPDYEVVGDVIGFRPVPSSTESIRLRYIPCAPVISGTGQNIDGVNGWDDLVVLVACKRVMIRQNLSTVQLRDEITEQWKRLDEAADTRDAGSPHRINDTYRRRWWGW